ncbi:MAG: histidine kinase [Chitinophaga sp.]|uniref:histidine kinase n=1 Tax=Chitinophaga sp. TaxID=1869181 RepID=UPI001B10D1E8|nr:histidine kinase [Chitinophaga sp.]MBO9729239.1 histidine kinase [Chitinophaga sp.]
MYFIKIACILVLVLLLSPRSQAQSNAPDTLLIHKWLLSIREKLDNNEPDSADWYLKKTSEKLNTALPGQKLKYLEYKGTWLYSRSQYREALETYQQALPLSLQLKNNTTSANIYNNMSIQYRCLGQLELATEYMIKALKILETQKDSAGLRRSYNNLSSVFLDLLDKKNSLFYAEKSYAIAVILKDSLQLAKSLVNLANAEVLYERYDTAAKHLLQVAAIASQLKNNSLLLHAYVNLGDIYNRSRQDQMGLSYYKKAAAILQANPDPDFDIYTNYGLANSYSNLGDPRTAKKYYDLAIASAKDLMPKNDLKEVYMLGASIEEKLHHPEAALALWKKYSQLNDSIVNGSTQKIIHEAEIKYQTSLKEKALVEQQLQISNNKVQLQKKDRFILLASVIIIALISVCLIIYLIYRNKNKLIALNLLKAQIHPHFLFNTLNNLYALSLRKSDKSSEVVLELSHILRYILYECNTPTVNLEKEIQMIQRYISLEKIRYQNQLEINMDIDGDLSAFNVAPLLILPLVENSFKHGISKLMEDGWINISAKAKNNEFTFKISNNKLPDNDSKAISSAFGNIGLLNIRKRLHFLYPNRHQLKIISEDEVFMVIMKIKLQ